MSELLNKYEAAFRQAINLQKSVISFSKGVNTNTRMEITRLIGLQMVDTHDKYMGFLGSLNRYFQQSFKYVVDRVKERLEKWDVYKLSKAGKETLIKSVIQVIPVHVMSLFLFPTSICHSIEKLIANFWWLGTKEPRRPMYWMSWKKLCFSKAEGGLGLREFRHFNVAMLAKQARGLVENTNSLVYKVLKALYLKNGSFGSATSGRRPSYVWKSLLAGQDELKCGLR